MELTEKKNAVICVLQRRGDICEKAIRAHKREIEKLQKEVEYLQAKKEGYDQAMDLLKSSLESISIEI